MKWISILTLFFSVNLVAKSTISSENLSFDGDLLMLDGKVSLHHPFGTLTSNQARLKKDASSTNLIFSRAILKNNVTINLKNNSKIECDLARIDFNTLLGDLTSEKGFVTFKDTLHTKEGEIPLSLTSRSINFKILKNLAQNGAQFEIDHLCAITDVVALYGNLYRISADKASYQRFNPLKKATKQKIPDGLLRLYSHLNPCHFESESLQFTSNNIVFNTKQGHIQMAQVQGTFNPSNSPTTFSCDRLGYQINKEQLFLNDNIHIKTTSFGTLDAVDHVEIHKKKLSEMDEIAHIKTKGDVVYRYLDHEFKCGGQTHLNCLSETFSATNKLKSDLNLSKQTTYTNDRFSVFADRVKMDYSKEDQEVEKLHLTGQVLLIMEDNDYPFQIALCEDLIYTPADNLIEMAALPGDKVLFWNRGEGISFSADELTITFDPKEKGNNAFQSFGNVRCFITEQEKNNLIEEWNKRQKKPA